jgi:AraC-like DNA-binding protein
MDFLPDARDDAGMGARRSSGGLTLARLLAESRRRGQRVEDLPPPLLREAQKRGFPDMRSIILPPRVIHESLTQPVLRDLLVTRIGYCARAAGHQIPRPAGSLDHLLHYCVAGQGWLRMAGREWSVPADTMMFIPRGEPHVYGADSEQPWSIYWIHLSGRQAADYFTALQVHREQPLVHLPCSEEILSAFEVIEGYMAAVHTPPNLLAASTALARFLGLVQVHRYAMTQPARTDEENIQQTIVFMQKNLARAISLRELAQLAHMSVSRYEAAFVARTGCPPKAYFNQMKIQAACRLLSDTTQPAKEIAAALGYADPYYFSRLFKKLVGRSPVQFRQARAPRSRLGNCRGRRGGAPK